MIYGLGKCSHLSLVQAPRGSCTVLAAIHLAWKVQVEVLLVLFERFHCLDFAKNKFCSYRAIAYIIYRLKHSSTGAHWTTATKTDGLSCFFLRKLVCMVAISQLITYHGSQKLRLLSCFMPFFWSWIWWSGTVQMVLQYNSEILC